MRILTEEILNDIETAAHTELAEAGGDWGRKVLPGYMLELVTEIRRLWARERVLLEANNAEVEKRRGAEARDRLVLMAKDYWMEEYSKARVERANLEQSENAREYWHEQYALMQKQRTKLENALWKINGIARRILAPWSDRPELAAALVDICTLVEEVLKNGPPESKPAR